MLGLDNLCSLTSQRDFKLKITLTDFDGKKYVAVYDHFKVRLQTILKFKLDVSIWSTFQFDVKFLVNWIEWCPLKFKTGAPKFSLDQKFTLIHGVFTHHCSLFKHSELKFVEEFYIM